MAENPGECGAPLLTSGRAAGSMGADDRQPAPVTRRHSSVVPVVWVIAALVAVQASFGGNAVVIKLALSGDADPVVFSFIFFDTSYDPFANCFP